MDNGLHASSAGRRVLATIVLVPVAGHKIKLPRCNPIGSLDSMSAEASTLILSLHQRLPVVNLLESHVLDRVRASFVVSL